jgi:hypothetical protein
LAWPAWGDGDALFMAWSTPTPGSSIPFSAGYAGYQALRSLNTWAWVIFFLGLGVRRLDFDHPLLHYG